MDEHALRSSALRGVDGARVSVLPVRITEGIEGLEDTIGADARGLLFRVHREDLGDAGVVTGVCFVVARPTHDVTWCDRAVLTTIDLDLRHSVRSPVDH